MKTGTYPALWKLVLPGLVALGIAVLWVACSQPAERVFTVSGVVKSIKPDGSAATIQHEAIPGYMDAMTMPFRVKQASELNGLGAGDVVRFQFHVTPDESWIDQVKVARSAARPTVTNSVSDGPVSPSPTSTLAVATASTNQASAHPLMTYKFTNQLGQAVSLSDFHGQALGITFIFTRCPVPDYCPRLSRNFQETAQKLSALPNAPTNWHLISFTIDPAWDTPKVLKAYAERYRYDPSHWSFLTGPADRIADMARESGVTVEPGAGLFSHNFRTLIVGTNGQLLTSIPIGGPISDSIVAEMLKALGR